MAGGAVSACRLSPEQIRMFERVFHAKSGKGRSSAKKELTYEC